MPVLKGLVTKSKLQDLYRPIGGFINSTGTKPDSMYVHLHSNIVTTGSQSTCTKFLVQCLL